MGFWSAQSVAGGSSQTTEVLLLLIPHKQTRCRPRLRAAGAALRVTLVQAFMQQPGNYPPCQ